MDEQKIGPNSARRMRKKYRVIAHLAVVIILLLLMYVFNNLIKWEAQLITPDWSKVLSILNISLGLTVLAHLLFIFYDPKKLQSAVQIAIDIVGLTVLYRMFTVYPFKFELFFEQAWLNSGFKIILPFLMAFTLIGIIIRTVKLLRK